MEEKVNALQGKAEEANADMQKQLELEQFSHRQRVKQAELKHDRDKRKAEYHEEDTLKTARDLEKVWCGARRIVA